MLIFACNEYNLYGVREGWMFKYDVYYISTDVGKALLICNKRQAKYTSLLFVFIDDLGWNDTSYQGGEFLTYYY